MTSRLYLLAFGLGSLALAGIAWAVVRYVRRAKVEVAAAQAREAKALREGGEGALAAASKDTMTALAKYQRAMRARLALTSAAAAVADVVRPKPSAKDVEDALKGAGL